MTTTIEVLGGDDVTRVPEDILHRDGGVLRNRGRLVYQGDVVRGFPGIAQHFEGTGQARPALSPSTHPGGLLCAGIGPEADGYGAREAGGAFYLRLGRSVEDCWTTVSGKIINTTEQDYSNGRLGFWVDTQAWDGTDRSYPRVRWIENNSADWSEGGQWRIGGNGTPESNHTSHPYISIPDATRRMGDNENKLDAFYFSLTTRIGRTSDAGTSAFGGYGAFQIGSQVHDLRGLGGGYAKHRPQTAAGSGDFDGGWNFGISCTNPFPGVWGGFILQRLEITVGDKLA